MREADNHRITRVGPGTPCGQLLRCYWQPAALVEEFDAALHPGMALRQVKPVRLLGQELVLFRDAQGRFGLFDRPCPHRGADLSFGRDEGDGLRCPFHGWKFAADGRCIETPGEPAGSRVCQSTRARTYPTKVVASVVFAWLGPEGSTPGHLPALDAFTAPVSHSFAFKGLWHANWLQCVEVGIDPAHPSFLHRTLKDAPLDADTYGRQFRNASAGQVAGERWPMSRVMREACSPDIRFEMATEGLTQITALRPIGHGTVHVRVTQSLFPQTFVIPLSETMTITQWHVPVDDEHTYWYSFFTSFDAALDQARMREQRACHQQADGSYRPLKGRHNGWGFNPEEQRERTFLGMGEDDINVHDQWAVESMGAITDRTRERLGHTDKVILHNRRLLMQAIDSVAAGHAPPMALADAAAAASLVGPVTWDGFAPTDDWQGHWRVQQQRTRSACAWVAAATSGAAEAAAALESTR
jgi:phenylpropionate dioxygenase-like ring-hydroxylating dioxygenase large terminal subunit